MGIITIIGAGWTEGQLTLDAAQALQSGARVILHTARCGCAHWLKARGIAFEALDDLYETCEDFDEHAEAAARAVLEAAGTGDVVYAVFDIRDRSVPALIRKAPRSRVIAGPPAEGALLAYVSGETRMVEASDWEDFHVTPREHCLVRELDNRELAAEVKLRLMEVYPEESEIWLMNAGAAPERMPLYALDRAERYDHRTCALIPAQRDILALERFDAEHLNELMRRLCGPDGCPWDRAQTHESLRGCILEEAYEVMDTIDEGDTDHLYDELGDMLLQIALHAEIARRHGEFDISDVTTAICEKMISRHTHVFGGDQAGAAEEVTGLWTRNKMAERGQSTWTEVLRGVTRTLPALLRAQKVLKRASEAGVGAADVDEALEDFTQAAEKLRGERTEETLGALLLKVVNAGRLIGLDPELALDGAVKRFIDRFEAAERELSKKGLTFADLGAETLRNYWENVKL